MRKLQRLGLGMALLLAATVRCASEDDSGGESLVGKTVETQTLLVGPEPQTISLGTTKRGATVVFPAGVTRSQTPITINLNDGVKKRGATVGGPVVEIVTAAVAFEAPAKMRQPLPPPPIGKSYVAVSSQKNDGSWAIKRGGVRVVGGGNPSNMGGAAGSTAGMLNAGATGTAGSGGRTGAGGGFVIPGAGGAAPVAGAAGGGISGEAGAGDSGGSGGRAGGAGGGPAITGGAGGGPAITGGVGGGAAITGGVGGGAPVGGAADGGAGGATAGGAGGGTAGGAGGGTAGGGAGTSQSTFTQLATDETLITYEIDILGTGYWGIALEDEGSGTGDTVPYAFPGCPPAVKLSSCGFSFMPNNIDPCTTLNADEAVCLHLCLESASCSQMLAVYCGTVPPDPADALYACASKCGGAKVIEETQIPCGQSGESYYESQRCDGVRDCSDSADEMGCVVKPEVNLYCPDGTQSRGGEGSAGMMGSRDPGSSMTAPAMTAPAMMP